MKMFTDVTESIRILTKLPITACLFFYAAVYPSVSAQGVTAGTTISNTAVVSYFLDNSQAGLPETLQATSTFIVAETINATLTSLDAQSVIVPTPATNSVLTWLLTNTGNGTESFFLTSIDTLVNDDFNPLVQTLWIETNGIPGLQDSDTLYQTETPPQLASDQSVTIYIKSNIPANLVQSQLGTVELTATSTTVDIENSLIGNSIPNAGDENTDAVLLIDNGQVNSTGTYLVTTVGLLLNKAVVNIVDPFSGSDVMSQSFITYQIDVNATGDSNGTLEGLTIEDTTPANMQYVAGSIKLNGTPLTDRADNDNADFGITKNNTVTLNLGNITPPSNQIITITYQVN